ncbi:Cdc37, N-terminal domain-containing protein [Nemania sp. FL0916]|nr:Cdc37, N-terminal domain-containing protein [Nemania sp. FL0916]
MIGHCKRDTLKLSDGSDIEVHPNVVKQSFIVNGRNQVHMERQQQRQQIEALKYELAVNGTLLRRLSAMYYSLKSNTHKDHTQLPASITFQAIMELAPGNGEEDNPPPPPEGLWDADQVMPSYSNMIMRILDDVNKKVNKTYPDKNQRYDMFVKEVGSHIQNMEDIQNGVVNRLDELLEENSKRITSESYHIGADSSYMSPRGPGGDF